MDIIDEAETTYTRLKDVVKPTTKEELDDDFTVNYAGMAPDVAYALKKQIKIRGKRNRPKWYRDIFGKKDKEAKKPKKDKEAKKPK
tara:strand:- start:3551 stop:3808 length:258 start_codon:yes stop_codon:yes gene_type:complete